jgi:hypothetical protein
MTDDQLDQTAREQERAIRDARETERAWIAKQPLKPLTLNVLLCEDLPTDLPARPRVGGSR